MDKSFIDNQQNCSSAFHIQLYFDDEDIEGSFLTIILILAIWTVIVVYSFMRQIMLLLVEEHCKDHLFS